MKPLRRLHPAGFDPWRGYLLAMTFQNHQQLEDRIRLASVHQGKGVLSLSPPASPGRGKRAPVAPGERHADIAFKASAFDQADRPNRT